MNMLDPGLLILGGSLMTVIAVAVLWHWRVPHYWPANFGAAATIGALAGGWAWVQSGAALMFIPFGLVTGMVALLFAILIGIPFRKRRGGPLPLDTTPLPHPADPAGFGALARPQLWKLYVGFGALFLSFIVNSTGLFGQRAWAALLSAVIAAVALLWLIFSIRCPSCGLSLFWYAMTRRRASEVQVWAVKVEQCPRCGSRGKSERV